MVRDYCGRCGSHHPACTLGDLGLLCFRSKKERISSWARGIGRHRADCLDPSSWPSCAARSRGRRFAFEETCRADKDLQTALCDRQSWFRGEIAGRTEAPPANEL